MALRTKDTLGVGWNFPFKFDSTSGGVRSTADGAGNVTTPPGEVKHLNMSLAQILGTNIGERVFRRDFGTRVPELVFDPADETMLALLSFFFDDGVRRWEKRLDVLQVDAQVDLKTSGIVNVLARYRVTRDNRVGNFVYPFYVPDQELPRT